MNRVVVTRAMIGLCHMQVCAVKKATNKEILEVCNSENPSGTTRGWCQVIRMGEKKFLPIQCEDYPDRLHFLVAC